MFDDPPEPQDDRSIDRALLTELDAAAYLQLSVRTLQAWRSQGRGPAFVRVGRAVRYRRSDLIVWVESNLVSVTSDGREAVR